MTVSLSFYRPADGLLKKVIVPTPGPYRWQSFIIYSVFCCQTLSRRRKKFDVTIDQSTGRHRHDASLRLDPIRRLALAGALIA